MNRRQRAALAEWQTAQRRTAIRAEEADAALAAAERSIRWGIVSPRARRALLAAIRASRVARQMEAASSARYRATIEADGGGSL